MCLYYVKKYLRRKYESSIPNRCSPSYKHALTNNKLQLEQLFIPSRALKLSYTHCGILGNKKADKLAKEGVQLQHDENPVCYTEMKTIIKSLHNIPQKYDSYHQLKIAEQTTILRLKTGHNRLNQHLYRVMKVIPSPMCPCGDAELN